LISKGVDESEILFTSVDINKEFDYSYDSEGNRYSQFSGYRLTQRVEIESKAVEQIERIAREITELINQGMEFYSNNPQYFYTQLSDLKIEMIASATEDARVRAEKICFEFSISNLVFNIFKPFSIYPRSPPEAWEVKIPSFPGIHACSA